VDERAVAATPAGFIDATACVCHDHSAGVAGVGLGVAPFEWQDLLTRWNAALLAWPEIARLVPADVLRRRGLGFPPATDAQIAAADARLGTTLPPSYQRFLAVSNGWRHTGTFIDRLWGADEVDWFRVRNRQWIDAWTTTPFGPYPPVADEDYFVYGPEQDSTAVRVAYLETAHEVSDVGDSAIYLLNPQVVTPEGEWEAWCFATWLPGAARYRSFWALMADEYESFLRLREYPASRPLSGRA
jgi:hypothetical protein